MAKVHDLLAAGRLIAKRKCPYFGTLITGLVPTECPGLGTIGVTKDLLLPFDPAWVEQRTQDEMGGLYYHETMHVVLDHHGRRGDKNPFIWNCAGDVFINDQGRNMGFKFPQGGLFPETFGLPKNLTTEEYYGLLLKQAEDAVQNAIDKAQASPGSWKSGNCGSGAGNPMDGEPQGGKGKGEDGKDEDLGGRSEGEIGQLRQRVAEAVRQHAASPGGKGRGSMPLGLDIWAEAALKPAGIPWQTKLSRALRQAVAYRPGAVDYSFSRISRRQGGVGFGVGAPIIPAFIRPVPRILFVLDTSGSMGPERLEAGLAEAVAVLKACGAEITFMSCDWDVHTHARVNNPRDLAKLVKGGGGSSFVPVFEHVRKMKNPPQLAVFATDGDICVPPSAPKNLNVIWLLIDAYNKDTPTTAYGERIVISTQGGVMDDSAA